jgi:hypothetical protein
MRPWTRRIGMALATSGVAAAVAAVPASASEPLSCRASVRMDWSTSGPFNAVVTATVYGTCSTVAWTTCLVTVTGAAGVVTGNYAGWGGCEGSATLVGVQNTPYLAVARVGYSADDYPQAVAVNYALPTSGPPA